MDRVRVKVFHAGTALEGRFDCHDGGRVLAVTAMGTDLQSAITAAYEAADMIEFEGRQMRRDIGWRALGGAAS